MVEGEEEVVVEAEEEVVVEAEEEVVVEGEEEGVVVVEEAVVAEAVVVVLVVLVVALLLLLLPPPLLLPQLRAPEQLDEEREGRRALLAREGLGMRGGVLGEVAQRHDRLHAHVRRRSGVGRVPG